MNRLVNFHMHSLHSDGVKSVPQLVELLKKHDVSWFALTDHETTDGFAKASRLAEEAGIRCIPGIELSIPLASCPLSFIEDWDSLHLLAYGFQPEAFSSRLRLHTPREAFAHIRKHRGISVWAHPYNLYQGGQKKPIGETQAAELAAWLKKEGIDGMEAHYYDFAPARRAQLAAIADGLSLIKGVGTDYHGWAGRDKPFIEAPEEPRILLDILRER